MNNLIRYEENNKQKYRKIPNNVYLLKERKQILKQLGTF